MRTRPPSLATEADRPRRGKSLRPSDRHPNETRGHGVETLLKRTCGHMVRSNNPFQQVKAYSTTHGHVNLRGKATQEELRVINEHISDLEAAGYEVTVFTELVQ